jgi:hypothetical protein
MIYLVIFFVLLIVVFLASYLVYVEKKRLEISSRYLKKALSRYRKKNFVDTIRFLKKALIVPPNNIINREEALHNVEVLELLGITLLHRNVDSDLLLQDLIVFLSNVRGVCGIDKKYFRAVKEVMRYPKNISTVSQIEVDSYLVSKGTEELSNEIVINWRKGIANLDITS